jgi:hypothetical protein
LCRFQRPWKGCQTKARPSINVYIKISKHKAM